MIGKNKPFLIFALVILVGIPNLSGQAPRVDSEVLWYRAPAPIWDHALPIGNGRLGAMVFGGANSGLNNGDEQVSRQNAPLLDGSQTSGADEHLQLNESSLWQGSRTNRLNPHAHEAVPVIRKLLLESQWLDGAKISAAEKLAQQDMIGIPAGMPGYSTLGDLYLRSTNEGINSEYRRQLDLNTGIVRITYSMSGVRYTREVSYGAARPDGCVHGWSIIGIICTTGNRPTRACR